MPKLNDPIDIKGLRLKNRLVMPPMVTGFAEDNAPTDRHLAWYQTHAQGGVGLVITEAAAITPDSLLMQRQLGVWDDAHIPGLKRIADAIHQTETPVVLQIAHGGARSFRADSSVERIGPSAVRLFPGLPPRPLTISDIAELVAAFAAAARRAADAGFDGVEIHAAHYYLLSQFLSPYANRRDDRYGGTLAGRARFLLEVVDAIRTQVGSKLLLFCRMHCVERMDGGLSTEELAKIAQMLEEAGIDVIDASAIGQASMVDDNGEQYLMTSSALAKTATAGDNVTYTAQIKRAVGIPVIAVGKLGEGDLARSAVEEGQADLVAIGRQLIADPLAARKILENRNSEIVRCEQCLLCFASIRKGPIKCSVNKAL